MENSIKIGGCYKTKDGGWLIANTRHGDLFTCHSIYIDEYGYDEEISEMTEEKIMQIVDLNVCYRPYYHKRKGLYKVWDETRPRSEAIVIQNIGE